MSLTLNNEPVLVASLHLPLNGAWSAELQVSSDVEYQVGDIVTLGLPGNVEYVGRVQRAGIFGERLRVRLTGGSVDWGQLVDARHYRDSDGDQALRDLGVQCEAPLELDLPFWSRPQDTIGSAVQALATLAQVNWRVLSNGTVRIRAEEPFSVSPDAQEIRRDAARGLVEVAPEAAVIQPGTTLGDDLIGDVLYDFGESGLRCRYYTESRARLRGALERVVRWVMRDTLYLGLYVCTVAAQNADGTLDVLPDDLRLRSSGLQSVPIRHGLPGVTVEVPAGERILLGFNDGDPRQPYCSLWHSGQVTKVRIGGEEAVALASLVSARLDAIQQAFDTHTHTVATTGTAAAQTGTAAPTAGVVGPLEPVASEVLETR
jgi:hypothetical protein